MLTAYLGLIIGIILIAYAVLSYVGSSLFASRPILQRKGDIWWLAGILLIGVAALFGWVGYIMGIDLRLARIIVAIVGVILAVVAWVIRPNR